MNRTIGTSFTNKSRSTVASTGNQEFYYTRFVSEPLTAQSISANTWTFSIATFQFNLNANFPRSGNGAIYLCVYLWRPGTGLVGFFVNGNSNGDAEEPTNALQYKSQVITFSGAAQTAQEGDVICLEVVSSTTQSSATSYNIAWSYDGDTEYATPNVNTGANIAAYLETPQNLSFVGDSISMDVTDTRNIVNKFIAKA